MHNDFTLFMRTYPNGKKVVFYHAYDESGKRVGPWTTNSRTLTAARNYCHSLIRAGVLIPNRNKVLTFGEYAQGFWERGSEYIKNQESRADITDNYINHSKGLVVNKLLPFFGDTPLDKITDKDVNKWLLAFREQKIEKDGKTEIMRYKNTYANTVFTTLSVMLAEAVRRGLIPSNPCDKVRRLKNDKKQIEILTVEEVQKLFPKDYQTVWGSNITAYAVNRLASLTGMRIGEILGLRGEYVFDDYIYVCGQYGDWGYVPHTKTKENRNIPLMPDMIGLLKKLMESNGKGFVFSLDGGAKPMCGGYIRKTFYKALNKIGISTAEIKRRALNIHGWRHFLNTELLKQGLTLQQVQGVTGHKSVRMTELYNHPDARQIADVVKAQSIIAGADMPEAEGPPQETGGGLKVVKMPERKPA